MLLMEAFQTDKIADRGKSIKATLMKPSLSHPFSLKTRKEKKLSEERRKIIKTTWKNNCKLPKVPP